MRRTKSPRLIALLVSGFLPVLLGRDLRAKVQGRVTDPTEAVVPGATIRLFNVKTNVPSARSTNEIGLYRFDYVDPGSYTVTIEAPGFGKFIQENVVVRGQADATVDAVLKPGGVQESVTVDASSAAVEFNSTSMTKTVDTKLVEDIARLDRNPFKLSLLNPAVLETRRNEMNPFQSLSANSMDLGGSTSFKNDLLVDGSPISIGTKASYTLHSARFPTWEYSPASRTPAHGTWAPEPRGAVHSWELQFVFGNLKQATEPPDRATSDHVTGYWTNFAKTGNSNGGALPNWPKHDARAAAYMDFSSDGPVAREGLRKQACALFEQALALQKTSPGRSRMYL